MTVEDIYDIFHLLRVSDGATGGSGLDSMTAEVAAISAFTKTDDHYTYTFDPAWILNDKDMTLEEEFDECANDQEDMSGTG